MTKTGEWDSGTARDGRGAPRADRAMSEYARGDARAFEIVYDSVAPRLEGYLRKRLRDQARIDDIIQQTFLQMHAARGSFIDGAAVVPWAFQIMKRISIDVLRKTRREEPRDFGDGGDDPGSTLASNTATPEEILQAHETSKSVVAAFERLSEPQQTALALRYQGLSCAESATAANTTITGIKLRVHRALQALRAVFDDHEEYPEDADPDGAGDR